jgi:flagellar hook-associated protein 1
VPSTFFGLNVALSGLTAQQRALDTVTHNLTNANTDGYSRQRVEMSAAPAFSEPSANTDTRAGQIGTGVQVTAYTRLRDQFIDAQLRDQAGALGQWSARADGTSRINTIMDEPGDTGLSSLLQNYWASWHALSLAPESAASREGVRASGQALVDGFHDLSSQLTRVQSDADAQISADVTSVNSLAGQVTTLNQQIAKVIAVGQTPNDLMDQRDALIDKMSSLANITVSQPNAANGKLSIAIGSQLLVDSTSDATNQLAVSGTGAVTVGGVATTMSSGAIRGLIDVRDTLIGGPTGYIAQLDALAGSVVSGVNAAHGAGYGLDGSTGNDFFAAGGTTAATIDLSAAVKGSLDKIAASDSAANVPGGSANAVAMAQLQTATQTIGSTTTTINGYWQAFVSQVGVDADQADRLAQVQQGIADATANRRDSVSGVNLDEEISDMVRFQKSYTAAARMITSVDEMLDTLINKMGLVGRG